MNKQAGMSFVGMLLTVVIIVIAGVTLMRIVPVYLEHYSVINSINALETIPETEFSSAPMVNAHLLKTKLKNQLYVNGVEIPDDKIKIKPDKDGKFTVSIKYQVKKSLVANMSLLFDFDVTREVKVGNK